MLLNCMNGTLRFIRPDGDAPARVELKPHDRGDMLTKLTACDYDPEAQADEWDKFVLWAQPKDGRRRYLQQWMGYNLTGDTGERSEEHTSELQSLMRISYAVFCLKKKKNK